MRETEDRKTARILVVDDIPANAKLLADLLQLQGYVTRSTQSGTEALALVARESWDLVLLDVVMPEMDGYEVCRKIRADSRHVALPVVMVTALDAKDERIKGLEAGADDFLSKPVNHAELLARVRSLLRIKQMHDSVQRQALELADWAATLEQRVASGVAEVERLSRLKRFFSPNVAELILNGGAGDPLHGHRREIVVVYLDLRGFTAFAERWEPEEVMRALAAYHTAMGKIVMRYEATLERFSGDSMMVFLGDPVPLSDPANKAVALALDMRDAALDALRDVAKARRRPRSRDRNRPGIRDGRRDRLRGAQRLCCHRDGDQPRLRGCASTRARARSFCRNAFMPSRADDRGRGPWRARISWLRASDPRMSLRRVGARRDARAEKADGQGRVTPTRQRVHIRQLCCLGLPGEQLLPTLLKAVREFVDADSAGFFWVDSQGDMTGLYAERILPAPVMKLYFERYYEADDSSFRRAFAARAVQAEPVLAESPSADAERTGYYNDVLRTLDAHHVLYGIVREQGRALGQLSLYRPKSAPAFTAIQRSELTSIMPYVAHGIAQRGSSKGEGGEFVDTEDDSMFMTDIDGSVRQLSMAARKLLTLALVGKLGPGRALPDIEEAARPTLRRLVERLRAILAAEEAGPPSVAVQNSWGRFVLRAYVLADAPLDESSTVAVRIKRQEPMLLRFVDALDDLGLSPQQREIAVGLARGATNRELAQAMGVTANTVAYHVKQLFHRLDAHDRQQMVVSVLASGKADT